MFASEEDGSQRQTMLSYLLQMFLARIRKEKTFGYTSNLILMT